MRIGATLLLFLLGKGSRKKSSFLNGRAIEANPPPPLGLMAIELFFMKVNKHFSGTEVPSPLSCLPFLVLRGMIGFNSSLIHPEGIIY